MNTDTICAVATAPGIGGIAVVRVSGPQAIANVGQLWQGTDLNTATSHTAHLGTILNTNGQPLDQVVLTIFRAPRSFTGEDVVELSCHGSQYVQQQLVLALIDAGCRHAGPGEFTQRAFLNRRLDLAQAEAVADLIAAHSDDAHRVALQQMRGGFSRQLANLRQQLLHFVALIELELDFSEEDVTFADRTQLRQLAHNLLTTIEHLAGSYRAGNAIRNGVPVAIIGQTNAGKSTLLNALLADDRALVSNVHGTTRDTIEEMLTINGTLIRLIDTAGLRNTDDTVEQMGIERTLQRAAQADVVVWMIDADNTGTDADLLAVAQQVATLNHDTHRRPIVVVNKTDLAAPDHVLHVIAPLLSTDTVRLTGSVHNAPFVAEIAEAIAEAAQQSLAPPHADEQASETADHVIVTNARHYHALCRAAEALRRVAEALAQNIPGDLLTQDIRETLYHLGQITGEVTTDDVLQEIFAHFCVGK